MFVVMVPVQEMEMAIVEVVGVAVMVNLRMATLGTVLVGMR
jgi:hypothetical protein